MSPKMAKTLRIMDCLAVVSVLMLVAVLFF
jgi:hypothetical protein